jgi:hypothetical protein
MDLIEMMIMLLTCTVVVCVVLALRNAWVSRQLKHLTRDVRTGTKSLGEVARQLDLIVHGKEILRITVEKRDDR